MKISLITVAYNSEETIEETILSVLSQKEIDLEYIVIDGASSDSTCNIIEKYKEHISVFVSEKDEGIYDAMNKGIHLASGDVIGILNSDDVFASNTILEKVNRAFERQNIDALYGDLVYVDRHNLDEVKRKWISGKYSTGDFKKGWMPPHPTFYVKKEVYEKYGVFNLDFSSAADYEIMLRFVHKHKIPLSYLPEIMVKMRQGGQSNASIINRLKANREDKKAWIVNGLKPGPFTLMLKPLSKLGQFIKK
jgi:glycosyltransferase involved in cell wall biosynthesis